ncbi:Uncharacterised protein [Mycobacteroides abscessus subsp. abscessus]|nr:Uncharacterised protein [Mycobacteroides abscessus subsp. abscessus]
MGDHVECLLDSPSAESSTLDMNICMFQVDRYVVQAYGRNLRDLHQKMAAQYVLLTAK